VCQRWWNLVEELLTQGFDKLVAAMEHAKDLAVAFTEALTVLPTRLISMLRAVAPATVLRVAFLSRTAAM
jgi:hypothetical protein